MTSVVYCFMEKVLHCLDNQLFVKQISSIGFLIYWESLLSTQGDEIGMLEDFIVAIHDVNTLQFKVTLLCHLWEVAHQYLWSGEVEIQLFY